MDRRIVSMVTLQAVSYMLPNGRFLLRNISLQILPREKIALLGANGSGKTTLIHLLAGVLQPTSGRLIWEPVPNPGEVQLLMQNPTFQTLGLTVREELAFGLQLLGWQEDRINTEIEQSLFRLQLPPHRELTQLSGGELQQVITEAVRIANPRFLLCDEPAMYLPPIRKKKLQNELLHDPFAMIWVTPHLSESLSFPRILVLHEGQIVFDGTSAELKTCSDKLYEWKLSSSEVAS